jgi:biopolymer transport protein ExbD/phage FluMu protein Com
MKLMIRCPKCAKVLAANPVVMGREIRCPDCDHLFRVEASMTVESGSTGTVNARRTVEQAEPERLPSKTPDGSQGSADSEDLLVSEPVQVDRLDSESPAPVLVEELPEEISFPTKELPKDDMDMTPMVDVTFLLLIFFMITASFSSEKVFEKPPPLSETPSTRPPDAPPEVLDSVRVQIDEFNAYTILFPGDEREASSKQDLLIALGDARNEVATGKEDENLKLIVEAHEECIHASIVAALDAGREKGFTSFTVTVVEEFE